METIFAAVVGQRDQVFYVGEENVEDAAKTLLARQPSLSDQSVTFYELPGAQAEFLNLGQGGVLEWPSGTVIRLEKLTGPIAD
ncbi:hypothetical protein AUC68_13345 [Methyloceanibacter methanicus]|uniref:Uncharacterized protein n=1 Tax=Methyloceanibacter methanicus TaxID=1774968 RepID=A0A1E3W541_9HYPH|nr:hypothetical protein [Methyloceanibacter methanicus]ODS00911.1 hypothetical protein AUC68_13345 [Methyloceanibacter methanicus]